MLKIPYCLINTAYSSTDYREYIILKTSYKISNISKSTIKTLNIAQNHIDIRKNNKNTEPKTNKHVKNKIWQKAYRQHTLAMQKSGKQKLTILQ